MAKKKVSKVKYSLQEVDYICPECHKYVPNKVDGKYFVPASLEIWGDMFTNTCPHCGYSFDNTTFVMGIDIQKFLPDIHPAVSQLLEDVFNASINANDFYLCCADDEAFEAFEKEIRNTEPDMERVEAAKKIFDGVKDIPVLRDYEQTHYGEPHLLELMDEWGVDGTNYADFRSVIQEHCLTKGLYAFADIEKAWKKHMKSLKEAVKNIKGDINED